MPLWQQNGQTMPESGENGNWRRSLKISPSFHLWYFIWAIWGYSLGGRAVCSSRYYVTIRSLSKLEALFASSFEKATWNMHSDKNKTAGARCWRWFHFLCLQYLLLLSFNVFLMRREMIGGLTDFIDRNTWNTRKGSGCRENFVASNWSSRTSKDSRLCFFLWQQI